MNDFLSNIPLIRNLTSLIELLLLVNVLLTGAVILLAFRAAQYKREAEDLENRLNQTIGSTVAEITPPETVPYRKARR